MHKRWLDPWAHGPVRTNGHCGHRRPPISISSKQGQPQEQEQGIPEACGGHAGKGRCWGDVWPLAGRRSPLPHRGEFHGAVRRWPPWVHGRCGSCLVAGVLHRRPYLSLRWAERRQQPPQLVVLVNVAINPLLHVCMCMGIIGMVVPNGCVCCKAACCVRLAPFVRCVG